MDEKYIQMGQKRNGEIIGSYVNNEYDVYQICFRLTIQILEAVPVEFLPDLILTQYDVFSSGRFIGERIGTKNTQQRIREALGFCDQD